MNLAIIFTAKAEETDAVKTQLMGPIRAGKTQRGNRFTVWHLRSSQNRGHAVPDLEVALYETGRGQTEAIIHTTHLVESFRPDIAMFVGCAGGDPDETSVDDVIVATEIWNYEPASLGAGSEVRYKGHPSKPDRVLIDESKVVSEFGRWRHRLPGGAKNNIIVHFGPVASGDKVVKSSQAETWRRIKESLCDDIVACETEGHGFLAAVDPLKTYGLMVRGISDTLDNKGVEGKKADDHNQTAATLHAAAFACQVLEEVDYGSLRAVKGQSAGGSPSLAEIVSIEFQTNLSKLPDAIRALKDVVGAERVTIRRVDQGSIIVVAEMEAKPAALAGALFDGGLLSTLIGFNVKQCISSIRATGDAEFDAWLKTVRHGDVGGAEDFLRSQRNRRWRELAKSLMRNLKERQLPRRGGWTRYVAAPQIRDLLFQAGISQRRVAEYSGYSASTLSRAMSGRPVAVSTAHRIHETLRELLRGDVPPFEEMFRPG